MAYTSFLRKRTELTYLKYWTTTAPTVIHIDRGHNLVNVSRPRSSTVAVHSLFVTMLPIPFSYCRILSCHLLLGLPLDLSPFLASHSVHLTVNLLSLRHYSRPALFHFFLLIIFRISDTLVYFRIVESSILSMSLKV